jgi:hypothetical protein
MKTIELVLGGLLVAAAYWVQPASAQGVPPGSYLRSCGNAYLQGDTLIATCRRMDGVDPVKPDTRRVGTECTRAVIGSPIGSAGERCCSPPSSYR